VQKACEMHVIGGGGGGDGGGGGGGGGGVAGDNNAAAAAAPQSRAEGFLDIDAVLHTTQSRSHHITQLQHNS
jgi:hypothetical protein